MALTAPPTGKHNVLRTGRKVKIFFQKFPGKDADAAVEGIDYELRIGHGKTVNGTTAKDGMVRFTLRKGEVASLKAIGTSYRIRLVEKLEPATKVKGLQRRLNGLGYNLGSADGTIGPRTERAILDFQADNDPLRVDGIYGPKTRSRLVQVAGE